MASYDGRILGRGVSGPGNAFAVGWNAATANLADALARALDDSGLRRAEIAAVGSASVEPSGEGSRPIRAAIHRVLGRGRVKALGDMQIALEGALGGGVGVVIVSGTGSVVFGRNRSGATFKVGGWGAVMGDEGSAQWIARQALAGAAHAVDGTGPRTRLVPTFLRHFRARSLHGTVGLVYRDTTPRALGALAPLVVGAAREGDGVARSILRRGGEALAAQAAAAIRRLRLRAPRVSYQGSVFRAGTVILTPLRRALQGFAPGATLAPPLLPPLGGAWLVGLEMLHVRPTRAAIAAFRRNCHDAFEGRMG